MKHLHRDLDKLKQEILAMGALVEEALRTATVALLDRRPELRDTVKAGDRVIDSREVSIEEECLKILALHQPVATDLRFIITALKVNNDLERVGDLAVNLAKRAHYLGSRPPIEFPHQLPTMVRKVERMLHDSLDSLVNLDTGLARRVRESDDEIDLLNKQTCEAAENLVRGNPDTTSRATKLMSASRALERIADLSTNIAEDVIFLVEGSVIRHQSLQD